MANLPRLALSIRQPWAWAIVHAGKDVENRTWETLRRLGFFDWRKNLEGAHA